MGNGGGCGEGSFHRMEAVRETVLPTGLYLQIPGEEGFGSAQSWPVNWLHY